MRKINSKLTALLLAIGCSTACAGVSIAINNSFTDCVTVEAETSYTTHNIGALDLHVNSSVGGASGLNNTLYLQRTDGGTLPILSWDYAFASSGGIFKVNGEQVPMGEMKSTGDGFFVTFGALNAGDVITIGGEFVCEAQATKYVIEESAFQWTGEKWLDFHSVGEMELHVNSSVGGASGLNNTLYLQRADKQKLPIESWDYMFTSASGTLKVNGEQVAMGEMKSTGDGFFVTFGALNAGDILTISGAFACPSQSTGYLIKESHFLWSGSGWTKYVPVVYTTYNVGQVRILNDSSASAVYFGKLSGKFDIVDGTWTEKLSFEAGSGVGVAINGTVINMNDIKIPNDIYVNLGTTAQEGDILTVSGTFYNANLKVKYVISESNFKWNGSAWETYVPRDTYNIGKVVIGNGSSASAVYFDKASGEKFEVTEGTWTEKLTFEAGSGVGITINGVAINMNDIKIPNNMYVGLGKTATTGDVLVIGGAFYNDALKVKYVIEESSFKWNGSAWVPYVEHDTYNIGKVVIGSNSSASAVYFDKASGTKFEVTDGTWAEKLTFEAGSGVGITFNGTQIAMNDIKIPNNLYVGLGKTATTGDVIVIGGAFYNDTLKVKYVIEESSFKWDGSNWVSNEAIQYETHNIGKVELHVNSSVGAAKDLNNQLYLQRADKQALPILSWDFAFVAEEGGLKVNGEAVAMNEMKSTGDGLYVKFGALQAGDIITIGGSFVCEAKASKYIIENSHFRWTGSGWEKYVYYDEYEIGEFLFSSGDAEAVYVRWDDGADLQGISSEDHTYTFLAGSGKGLTLNGETMSGATIKVVDGQLWISFGEALNEGDILAMDGVFYNEEMNAKIIVNVGTAFLQYNGESWDETSPDVYDLGKMVLNTPSTNGDASTVSSQLYLKREDGEALPVTNWDVMFDYMYGDGLLVNGESANLYEVKSTDAGLWFRFDSVKVGDKVTVSGAYFCPSENAMYEFTSATFIWNGTVWEIDRSYTAHQLGALIANEHESNAEALYLQRLSGDACPVNSWDDAFMFRADSGNGVTFNGATLSTWGMKSPGGKVYFALGRTAQKGDVLTIDGTFYAASLGIEYVIDNCVLIYNGTKWINSFVDESLAYYDKVSIYDLGIGATKTINGTYDASGLSYTMSNENTTGSVKFSFGFNSSNMASNSLEIRLRGAAWNGIRFLLLGGSLQGFYLANPTAYALESNRDYDIEIGAIDLLDGNHIWIFATVDGELVMSDIVKKTDVNPNEEGTPEFSTYTTNSVSVYAGATTKCVLNDPNYVTITYTTRYGSYVQYVENDTEISLHEGKTYNVFAGWLFDGELYAVDEVIEVGTTDLFFEAVDLDFVLEDGAAIRLSNSADDSGIRFTSKIELADLAVLTQYGVTVSYGTLIMPYDYLEQGKEAPNLEDFEAGETVLQIPSTYQEEDGDFLVYRGAMKKLFTTNYERLFAGRGYMTLTFENGTTRTIYTNFDEDDNVRSIRYVAQSLQDDTTEYTELSATKKGVVDTYAARDSISLMNYQAYAKMNFLNLIAWYYPALDESNNYVNDQNVAIATKLKAAGIKAIYLDGAHHLDLAEASNIEKTRQIIKFFWSQGLYTIAYGSNAGAENIAIDYSVKDFPDFSDCEGFIGFLVWDEPFDEPSDEPSELTNMDKLAAFVGNFEIVYAGTGVTYMTNLLPSYASLFQKNSNSFWGSSSTLDKDAYKAYLEEYCEKVLKQVNGEKWLSLDSYPINADYSLSDTFLFDLAMLKYYSIQYDAHAHIVLQSSGWTEEGNTDKNRMPTEAEMRMQAYAAMAFGVDSISWWSYANKRGDDQSNPTDSEDYYTRFANVNKELAAVGAVYSAFNWKGVILGAGRDNWTSDDDYEAYEAVMGQIGAYELTASKTKHLSSVSTNKTDWDYLMGVMQDMNGNEGYVICNYNGGNKNATSRQQTLTLTFNKNITEVVVYRGGVPTTVTVTNQKLSITLTSGEGVMVLPSKVN